MRESSFDGSTIILVDPNSGAASSTIQGFRVKESYSSRELTDGQVKIILVDPKYRASSTPKPVSQSGQDSLLTSVNNQNRNFQENDESVIILVDPPGNINTLNPTLKPPAKHLSPPLPVAQSLSQNIMFQETGISRVKSQGNTLRPTNNLAANSRQEGNTFDQRPNDNSDGQYSVSGMDFVRSRTRRLRGQGRVRQQVASKDFLDGSAEFPSRYSDRKRRPSINQNKRRRRLPRRRGSSNRRRDNVSGRNDFLLSLGRGRGPSNNRNIRNYSDINKSPSRRENIAPRRTESNRNDRDFVNDNREGDSQKFRFLPVSSRERDFENRFSEREEKSTVANIFARNNEFLSTTSSTRSFSNDDDFVLRSRPNRNELPNRSREIPTIESSGYTDSARGSGYRFSWLNPASAEVNVFQDDASIPEKIRELRQSIEAKARAWTEIGLQRTRPEFRKTRRPAIG
ncbi:hypothetical protein SK128_013145 [Halocaridina rubra]|uniref:Uncharacterized protein n=1 Tax=Halocaridina rubra TaxID=373956 RepID=A0AAN8WU68_HALRR